MYDISLNVTICGAPFCQRVAREGIWVYVSLRPEITMAAYKQLTVLWCWTIWISNPGMEGFWVQLSTRVAVIGSRWDWPLQSVWSRYLTVFQFSKTLARVVSVKCYRTCEIETHYWWTLWVGQFNPKSSWALRSKGLITRFPYLLVLDCCSATSTYPNVGCHC